MARLVDFTVQGFQSYRTPQAVPIDPHVTFLAGRNNVGKSALLRAMRVFDEEQEGALQDFGLTYRWATSASEIAMAASTDVEDDWFRKVRERTLSATFTERGHRGVVGGLSGGETPRLIRVELEEDAAVGTRSPGWAWALTILRRSK